MFKNSTKDDYTATHIVDRFIKQAIENWASDIHIEPEDASVRIRYRIDGVLVEVEKLPLNVLNNLISRVKVLANLDIAENRRPQDGRFEIHSPSVIDMRVSVFPTVYGECAVIRILDQSKLMNSFAELGFHEDQLKTFEEMIKKPYGLILVTGPTGSGKTTTLFSILNNINSPKRCIVTLEDPVEYHLPFIRQSQINEDIGFGFAEGLRSLFRQNPDVIMIGEIRDRKTADIAIQAAMTGHLVLSTLHTNDSVGALIRLSEMRLEKFLITSATIGIIAQRLVRRICPDCKEEYQPQENLISMINSQDLPKIFYHSKGCEMCNNTGYRGRVGIFEILTPSPEVNKLVYKEASWQDLFNMATSQGMISLRKSGMKMVENGITTLEEVLRVTNK